MAGDKKYTRNLLVKKTVAELKALWTDDEGRDITDLDDDAKKADFVNALLEIEESEEEELDDELDEELDDEEELPEEEDEAEPDLDDEEDLELPEEDEEDDIEEEKPAPKKSRSKKKQPVEGEPTTLAAKQVASILQTEAKTLRQFFRSPASTIEAVGSGGRYEFLESDIDQIKTEFEAWKSGHASRGNKRTEGGTTKKSRKAAADPVVIEEVEELEIEELEDEELELEDED